LSCRNVSFDFLELNCKAPCMDGHTHRYFRYLPENGMCVTTSILPSLTWEIVMESPRLPTRPSTLILSCKNFSKAERSKILSLTGCVQLMVYLKTMLVTRETGSESSSKETHRERRGCETCTLHTFLVTFAGLPFCAFCASRQVLAYCSSSHHRTRREVDSKAVMYIL
jgi:hypothetical protein